MQYKDPSQGVDGSGSGGSDPSISGSLTHYQLGAAPVQKQ